MCLNFDRFDPALATCDSSLWRPRSGHLSSYQTSHAIYVHPSCIQHARQHTCSSPAIGETHKQGCLTI